MSDLYMSTEEFAALVVNALDEQEYFKRGVKAHPDDIATAFSALSETIGTALSWAVAKKYEANKKNAVMETKDLKKVESELLQKDESLVKPSTIEYYKKIFGKGSVTIPVDPEFDPIEEVAAMYENEELAYNEWKLNKRNNGLR
jgi:hypothetical protein